MSKSNEELNKSIDLLIEELFSVESAPVEKSLDIAKDSKTKADEAINQAPKMQNDDSRGAGRPKQMHDMPQNDQDGQSSKDYDSAISEKSKEEDQEEIDQISDMSQVEEKGRVKPSSKAPQMPPFQKSLSEVEYAEYLELKKAKEESKVEELKKAEAQKTEDLIKSIVERTASRYENKISSLQKSLSEQEALIKSMANQPQRAKSITNVEALEKSMPEYSNDTKASFSKSELLDAAEELVKARKLSVDHVIELENNGYIFNAQARQTLEQYLSKRQ